MYEGIIDAMMKLFALMVIQSKKHTHLDKAKSTVKEYLKNRYNTQISNKYFSDFEAHYSHFEKYGTEEEEDLEASRLLQEVCQQINEEYNFEVKVNLLLSLLKFGVRNPQAEEDEIQFLQKLVKALKIDEGTFENLKAFVLHGAEKVKDKSLVRIVQGNEENLIDGIQFIINPTQVVIIQFLWLPLAKLLVVRYSGSRNMYINGHKMQQDTVYVFPPGAMIKTSRIQPVYQSDIMASYIQKEGQARIVYTAENVEYKFNRNQTGLHKFNFRETSGHFVGILGGSGVGKTTLINVLNGNLKPSSGSIKINGHDLHEEAETLEGIIGYVPQEDLLIEELTVFQNLYYNAKLCFSGMDEDTLIQKVEDSILAFDLVEARDLIVGNPMQKVLSGGQRKRLNIALELMREPLVLLADEPTSGLSSMDTEKVVSLLKRHCLRGGLVIANIHQPASDIYKQFDRVIVMDKGGRVVYSGNPFDAISYFKNEANYINPDETHCPSCGNIKVEQPLRILEERMVSPTGRFIRQRKVDAQRWFEIYQEKIEPKIKKDITTKKKIEDTPKNNFKTPGRFEQFKTFFKRDFLSKLTNKQYLLIAAIESPLLAFIFAFFAKAKTNGEYIFAHNNNLASYLFMSVVVALFIGMSVSAEEIFKDRLILKREAFLNLSRSAYLSAKISIVFLISAIQMLIYVLIANSILEIQGMTFYFWIALFSTACFANILALNLSAGLKSVVAIYVLIPLMLIPQLLFSGVIVDFSNMNTRGNPSYTPIISDAMAARWAYEAIAVEQYKNNKIQKYIFDDRLAVEETSFEYFYRVPEVENIIYTIEQGISNGEKKRNSFYLLLQNEAKTLGMPTAIVQSIKKEMSLEDLTQVKDALKASKSSINNTLKAQQETLDESKALQEKELGGAEQLNLLKKRYINEKLEETLTGRYQRDRLIYYKNNIIQLDNPVFHVDESPIGRSHFYAPYKMILGKRIEVLTYNLGIIWLMIIFLGLILYTDILKKTLDYFENLRLARITRDSLKREENNHRKQRKEKQQRKSDL